MSKCCSKKCSKKLIQKIKILKKYSYVVLQPNIIPMLKHDICDGRRASYLPADT